MITNNDKVHLLHKCPQLRNEEIYRTCRGNLTLIQESLKKEIETAVNHRLKNQESFKWNPLVAGYTNEKYLLSGKNKDSLAVCKIFTEDGIYNHKQRFEREVQALEFYNGSIAPKIIWKKESEVVVYEYVEGTELHLIKIEESMSDKLEEVIKSIHKISNTQRKAMKTDVVLFYAKLAQSYEKSELGYPTKLINKLKDLINQQKEILDEYQEKLTYVHGDLIPPNFILSKDKFVLIDWEFSRPELPFFDYQYFNYYSKAHDLPFKLEIEEEAQEYYNNIVDVLERLWRHGYEQKNKKIFYHL